MPGQVAMGAEGAGAGQREHGQDGTNREIVPQRDVGGAEVRQFCEPVQPRAGTAKERVGPFDGRGLHFDGRGDGI